MSSRCKHYDRRSWWFGFPGLSRLRPAILWLECLGCLGFAADLAAPVPATLPRPDGKPGDMTKKVKVYILAGQSNMVGFGMLKGASPAYPSIFLSADPSVMPGRMPVGNSALLPLKVRQSADQDAPVGAKAAVYKGAFDPKADYAAMKPEKETRSESPIFDTFCFSVSR